MGAAGQQGLPRHRPELRPPRTALDDRRVTRRQRIRPPTPRRATESCCLMTISVLRTADAWWVRTPDGAAPIHTSATTTGALLADRSAIDTARSGGSVPLDALELISPVTAPCRVVAQMTNFESHFRDAGMDPATVPLTFFRKSSASMS